MTKKNRHKWVECTITILIFVIVLGIYNTTLTPSLSYKSPDGNEMATIPYILGLAHMTGYPLYTWLGKLFTYIPVGDIAHRMNLMSAILGAGGVVLLYLIMRELTGRDNVSSLLVSRISSILSALLFGFSLTFWSQTGIAEVYAPNIFMVALFIWFLLRWIRAQENNHPQAYLWLWAFGLSFGLSMGTHMSNLGFAPGIALGILLVDWRFIIKPKEFFGTVAAFCLGILQFIWLPIKAQTLNDAPMIRNAPNTFQGIYKYTLGAFPQLKFAFPLTSIPDRIVIYLYLLRQQYFIPGIMFGIHGMIEMLFRKPKRFFLLIIMYLTQVIFFIQYRAFDLDVFFIPAHFIYVIFIGYSVYHLISYSWNWAKSLPGVWGSLAKFSMVGITILLLLMPLRKEFKENWARNDYSADTAINDFYTNVWKILPQDSVLLGRSGVFGYDMFYYRLVYNIRPDVIIPHLDTPEPDPILLSERDIYSTTRLDQGVRRPGPGSLPPELAPEDSWYVPILLGQSSNNTFGRGQELTLFQVTTSPPELVVQNANPSYPIDQVVNGWRFLGYDLDNTITTPGSTIHLKLYWHASKENNKINNIPVITTLIGDIPLESHQLGLGNLNKYMKEFHPSKDGVIIEDYSIVIPSTLVTGEYQLGISVQTMFPQIKNKVIEPDIYLKIISVQKKLIK